MELQKFISESIKQICFGIRDARKEIINELDGNCPIAPANYNGKKVAEKPEEIAFDIAITITKNSKLGVAGGANIKVIKGDIKKESSKATENIHRINFKVPFYPQALNNKFKNNKKLK
jgi:hypothetical protein